MRKAKSKFVQKFIQENPFTESKINPDISGHLALLDLLDIERAVTTKAADMAESKRRRALLERYSKAAHAIYRELNPEGYAAWARERRGNRKRRTRAPLTDEAGTIAREATPACALEEVGRPIVSKRSPKKPPSSKAGEEDVQFARAALELFGDKPSVVVDRKRIRLMKIRLSNAEKRAIAKAFPGVTLVSGSPTTLTFKSVKEATRCYTLMWSADSPFFPTLKIGTFYSVTTCSFHHRDGEIQ